MRRIIFQLLPLMLLSANLALAAEAPARPVNPAQAKVTLTTSTEDGKHMLVATVTTAAGKPVEGARVAFFVQRTFGQLKLSEDTTLDDGTAAASFPDALPSGTQGQLAIAARVLQPAVYAGACVTQTFTGGVALKPQADPFPRALWAPHAPLALLIVIFSLLGGVWIVYANVVRQLFLIHRGGL